MESRLIYKATKALICQLIFDDWIHFGTDPIRVDLVFEKVNSAFENYETLLFVQERTNSEIVAKQFIMDKIRPLLGKENFFLWNEKMEVAIEFNSIGVLRSCFKTS